MSDEMVEGVARRGGLVWIEKRSEIAIFDPVELEVPWGISVSCIPVWVCKGQEMESKQRLMFLPQRDEEVRKWYWNEER
jgi:hypothetical protein